MIIESRVWAAVNLLQARENDELALSLIGQIHTDLSRVNDWGSADAAWRLTLGFHAGRAGHLAASQAIMAPLPASADPRIAAAAVRIPHAAQDPHADVRLQIETLEAQLAGAVTDDDRLGLHAALAAAYNRIGEYRKALHHARRELRLRERTQGPEHPDTLTSRHNLAHWTGEAGDQAGRGICSRSCCPTSNESSAPSTRWLSTGTALAREPAPARHPWSCPAPLARAVPCAVPRGRRRPRCRCWPR